MTAQAMSTLYRERSIHFFEKARSYEDMGLIRIAEDLKDAARSFAETSAYLDQPWIRDKPWEEAKGSAVQS